MIVGDIILLIIYIGFLPIGIYLLYLDEKEDFLSWKSLLSAILLAIWITMTALYLISIDWSPLIAWWNSEV